MARKTKHLDRGYINDAGNGVLDNFRDYAAPLAGELPRVGLLG